MGDAVRVSGSLRNRLAFTLVGSAAILAILLFVVVRGYATQIAQQGQDSVIKAAVVAILDTAVLREGTVEIDFPYASFSMLSTPSDDRVFYAIYQDDALLSGYAGLPRIDEKSGESATSRTAEYQGTRVRLASASRTLVGADTRTRISVSVAQTQDELSGTLNQISRNVAAFGAGFFVLAALIAFWATSTTIGQLKALATSVTRRGPQDLSPVTTPVPTEMAPLVESLNTFMGRLDHSLQQSETFIAEAAHRVRTPLATVRSYAETTLQRVEKSENRQALRSMVRAIDESSRAAGQILDHAMITFRADHLDRQDMDLAGVVRDLITRLTPIAAMKDIDIRQRGDEAVPYSGDAILIQNAIRNLVDNALKYSPAESAIVISVTAGQNPEIQICDEGPGFSADEMESVVTRFARGRNVAGIVGSGLGLTIALDVARAHGGSLDLANGPKGGACVTLSL